MTEILLSLSYVKQPRFDLFFFDLASQVGILKNNLDGVMNGKDITGNRKYDGYTSCPLVVG